MNMITTIVILLIIILLLLLQLLLLLPPPTPALFIINYDDRYNGNNGYDKKYDKITTMHNKKINIIDTIEYDNNTAVLLRVMPAVSYDHYKAVISMLIDSNMKFSIDVH